MVDASTSLFGFEGARLLDAHVHLDFMDNAREVAQDASSRGLCLFANTVTPDGFVRASELVGDLPNVRVGLGIHPRWVADGVCGEEEVARCMELVPTTRWVGEVGLDFSARYTHGDARKRQFEAFEQVVRACAQVGGRVLSIHAVRSVAMVLDVLCDTGCNERCICILHWFSGSTDELWRAIRAGCWFSVNERQAGARRSKEQLKLIPPERMLFETDLPPEEGMVFSAGEIESSLVRARELSRRLSRRG